MAMGRDDVKGNFPPLNSKNYATWRIQCRMALMREGLWSIVSGEEERPAAEENQRRESEEARRKFKIRYEKALTTIVLAVSPELLYLLNEPEDPVVVWNTLAKQFQKRTWANKLSLRRKLYNLKLKESQPVENHIKEMSEIFQELSIIGDPIEEEDRVVHLLASLPDKFSMLVTALESNAEVPSFEVVTEKIMHEERKLKDKIESNDRTNKALNVGRDLGREAGREKRENFEKRGSPTCYYCHKQGHIARYCEKLRKDKNERQKSKHKNSANISRMKQKYDEEDSSDSESGFVTVGSYALASVTEKERKKWLVDSGASSHMANDESQFTEQRKLEEPENIKVGDGYFVKAEYEGTVELEVEVNGKMQKCTLKNVLYVPELSYNLLSVSKATDAGKKVLFNENGCEIKNKRNKILLTATKRKSLFYVNTSTRSETIETESANNVENETVVSKERVWHSRYGHLGNQSLTKLAKESNFTSDFGHTRHFSRVLLSKSYSKSHIHKIG